MSLNSLVYVHYNSKLCKQQKEESVDEFVQVNWLSSQCLMGPNGVKLSKRIMLTGAHH